MAMNFNAISVAFAQHLPVCVVGGVAIIMLAWAILRVIARRNPRERFAVWFGALIAVAALLLLGGVPTDGPVSVSTVAARHALFEVPASWAAYAFVAWLAVVFVALARIGVGLWQLGRLKRTCVDIDQRKLAPELVTCLAQSRRRVSVSISERATCPTAMGLVGRARIVLPAWTLQELSPADLKQVVFHELAHLQRWDDWTNLAQKVLRAFLFFHPLVWLVETKLTLEREMACDDLVLGRTQDPRAYAECLARLVEKSFARRSLALAQAAVGKLKQTSARVARILHLNGPAESRRWVPAAALVVVSSFAGLLALHAPNIIAFDEPESPAINPVSASGFVPTKAVAQIHPSRAAHVVRTAAQARAESPESARKDLELATPTRVELTSARAAQREHQTAPRAIKAKYIASTQGSQRFTADRSAPTRVVQQQAIVQQATFVIVNDSFNGNQAVVFRVVWRVASVPNQHPVHTQTGATKT